MMIEILSLVSYHILSPLRHSTLADMTWWLWALQTCGSIYDQRLRVRFSSLSHIYLVPPQEVAQKRDGQWLEWHWQSQQQSQAWLKAASSEFMSSVEQQTALVSSLKGCVADMPHWTVIHTLQVLCRTVVFLTIPPPHTNLTFLFQGPHN